ncbi:hypothetical protein P9112_013379 [Eukaryota sp. TZLM1-RC]
MIIAFSGIDCSGKSTLASKFNYPIIKLPDRTTDTGKIIDDFLKGNINMSEKEIQLIFAKNRNEKIDEIEFYDTVIMDRCWIDGVAHSSANGGSMLWTMDQAIGEYIPDVVFLFTQQYHRKEKERYDGNVEKTLTQFRKILRLLKIRYFEITSDDPFEFINERIQKTTSKRLKLKKKIIGVDMDDTLCRTTEIINEINSDFEYSPCPTKFRANGQEIFSEKGFFKNLKPNMRMVNIVRQFIEDDFQVYFVTAGYHKMIDSGLREEKQECLKKYFLTIYIPDHLININHKHLLKMDLLIDDKEHYRSDDYLFIGVDQFHLDYSEIIGILFS